ncbi:amidase family protein [Pelagicoccus sp. SDUM812003]|uniref:amidase n=1 Tax=Pelagicoccus sp. SDUM812003 TaxID=3041267 RepID=UPI00280DADC9|nr:amidase family protein [Pelagicoccus sp. SDUM812003]MDQ8204675.1 amidase family protein [Pelagicoccus sp. SDUM812003]
MNTSRIVRYKNRLRGAWLLLLSFAAPLLSRAEFELIEATIADAHRAFRSGELTAKELTQMYLDRIEAYDQKGPAINCVISINPDALEDAEALDAAFAKDGFVGPLHGIPVLVKDEIDVADMATTLGTLVFKDYVTPKDAFVIEKLRQAGAIILGKTTLSEYAGGDTYGSFFGASLNPYDLTRTVGGSSGGSGGAMAANFAMISLGEETYASIRRPSTWNGVVGLRPTPGLVSRTGMWDGYPTVAAQMGPMCRTVEDTAKLLDVMVGYDPEDPSTAWGIGRAPKSYTDALEKEGLVGARVGVIRESIGGRSDPSSDDFKIVQKEYDRAVDELKAAGAIVIDDLKIPELKELMSLRSDDRWLNEEALRIYLARNPDSPIKTHQDIGNSPYIDQSIPPRKGERWTSPPRETDYQAAIEGNRARQELLTRILAVMAEHDLDAIVHNSVEHQPSLVKDGFNPPYVSGKGVPSINTNVRMLSAITVPSGFTSMGLPTGITFLGRPYDEATILKLAYSYEQSFPHRKSPETTPPLSDS